MSTISGPFSYFSNPLFRPPSSVTNALSGESSPNPSPPHLAASVIPLAAARGKTKKFIQESSRVHNALMTISKPIGGGGKALQTVDGIGGLAFAWFNSLLKIPKSLCPLHLP